MPESLRNTLMFEDAVRLNGPSSFNIVIKPAGSLCNLDCHYCYYLDKSDIYHGNEPRMTLEMLETVIREYIAANDVPEVTFNWHGGEPLVMGLEFYRKAVELEGKYAAGKIVHNTLQTNGTLINGEWADFFSEKDFLVGISIDGPEHIHDRYRKDKGGASTFDRVLRGINLLQQHGVQFNTMSTVNKAGEGHGLEVYHFLKSLGCHYMQFMPVVEHVVYPADMSGRIDKKSRPRIVDPDTPGAALAQWSVSARGFGEFMCDIFDEWVRNDVGQYFVNLFDATLANWCGVKPGTCAFARTCGGNSVIEHNGDLYPCDHFVYPKYLLGNIKVDSIRSMMNSSPQLRFGIDKWNTLPANCLRCNYVHLCYGECPKHRFNRTESGEKGLNALCSGYYMFFKHTEPYMKVMKALLEQNCAPAEVMQFARKGL